MMKQVEHFCIHTFELCVIQYIVFVVTMCIRERWKRKNSSMYYWNKDADRALSNIHLLKYWN